MVSEQFNALVFDLGSSSVRAGWAGHDQPKFIETSFLGRKSDGSLDPVPCRFLNSKRNNDAVTVHRAITFDHEISEWVVDKDCLAALSETLLYSSRGLQCLPAERPVFATCPTGASVDVKKAYYEHFMESAEVPAFFLGDTSVLAMYASGRVSGLCVDMGASASIVAQVSRGQISDYAIHTTAGDVIDNFILGRVDGIDAPSNLPESISEQTRLAIVRELKHNACRCSHRALPPPPTPSGLRSTRGTRKAAPLPSPTHKGEHAMFKLPDGTEVDVANVQEYAAEVIFAPTGEYPGLTAAVCEGLVGIEEEEKFVLLTGGSAHFHGLHTRLVNELDAALGVGKTSVFPFAQWTHRVHSSFLGASILASLSSFASLWVTPASFLENGLDRILAQP